MAQELSVSMISREQARSIIDTVEQEAQRIGQPMNVAVVDAGRELKAFSRMDDAWLGSIDIAINKAYTAASFKLSTQDLAGMAQPNGGSLYGIHVTNDSRIVIFAGGIHGVPVVRRDNEVAGAPMMVPVGGVMEDQAVDRDRASVVSERADPARPHCLFAVGLEPIGASGLPERADGRPDQARFATRLPRPVTRKPTVHTESVCTLPSRQRTCIWKMPLVAEAV